MTTHHYVAKALDIIPGGPRDRAQVIVQTQEGPTVVLYLPEKLEDGFRSDAATYLRPTGTGVITGYAVKAKGGELVAGPYRTFADASRILSETLLEQGDYATPTVLGWHVAEMETSRVFNLTTPGWEAA